MNRRGVASKREERVLELLNPTKEVEEGGSRQERVSRRRVRKSAALSESSRVSEDLNKAIMVYGAVSPMSEMTAGLKKVKLKRGLEEGEERQYNKSR